MKKVTIVNTLIVLLGFACKAQTPIEPRYSNPDYGYQEGAYYKDLDNDYDRFEGTWEYHNGMDTLKIVLVKREMQYIDNSGYSIGPSYYQDMLVGEYRYVENGIEKVNTLGYLNINNDPLSFNLTGGIIQKYNPNAASGYCSGCEPGQVKVGLSFSEPGVNIDGIYYYYYFRHFLESGVEKLELTIYYQGMEVYNINDGPSNDEYSIPMDRYILVKQ
jgi:hypothetical protein